MSAQAEHWVLELSPALPISSTDRFVALIIAHYADASGWSWGIRALMARQTGLAPETISRSVKRLSDAGLLAVQRAAHKLKSGRKVNGYQLLMDGAVLTVKVEDAEHRIIMAAEVAEAETSCDAGSHDGSQSDVTHDHASRDAGSRDHIGEVTNHNPLLNPPHREDLSQNGFEKSKVPSWDKFEDRWQGIVVWRTNENRSRAKKEFWKLQPADRAKAHDRIKAWKERCQLDKPDAAVPRALAYLREGMWKPIEQAKSQNYVFVKYDDPAFDACVAAHSEALKRATPLTRSFYQQINPVGAHMPAEHVGHLLKPAKVGAP